MGASDFFHVPAEPRQCTNSAPYLAAHGKCTRSRRLNQPKSSSVTNKVSFPGFHTMQTSPHRINSRYLRHCARERRPPNESWMNSLGSVEFGGYFVRSERSWEMAWRQ